MQSGNKSVCGGGRVYLVVLMLLLIPVCVMGGGTQLNFEWDPNPEPDIAGYRVFSREPGQDFDYDNPDWEGQENDCSVFIDDEDAVYLFVVRAFDENGYESDDSNEVVYPDGSDYEDDNSNEGVYSGDSRYISGPESSSDSGCFIGTLK